MLQFEVASPKLFGTPTTQHTDPTTPKRPHAFFEQASNALCADGEASCPAGTAGLETIDL